MKILFLYFFISLFVFSSASAEKSAEENSEEKLFFDVEDTFKNSSQDFVIMQEEEKAAPVPEPAEEPAVISPPEEPVVVSEVEEPPPEPEVVEPPQVDILIVVDSSGSMNFLLEDIGRKMQTFQETLNPLDYRVAFLNAKVVPDQEKRLMELEHRGQIFSQQKFLEPGMDHQILIDTLVRGKEDKCERPPYCGGRSERPLGALEAYLFSREESFIRESSKGLAVVIITDNEENSASKTEPATTATDVLSIFHQRYPGQKLKAYTLTILDQACQREVRRDQFIFREGHFAPSVAALADQTGGKSLSLCLSSYQAAAEHIVEDFLITDESGF